MGASAPVKYHYSWSEFTHYIKLGRAFGTGSCVKPGLPGDLRVRQSQVGSLAGAAHLLNDNTGVLR